MVTNRIDLETIIVADAGPLIHLTELGALRFLADFGRVLVPDAVWSEVSQHRPDALLQLGDVLKKIAPPPPSPEMQSVGKLYTLHRGEWEALLVCSQMKGSRLLTDDTAARLAAQAIQVASTGTIGILLRALRRDLCRKAELIALLESIPISTSLHLRPSLLQQIIAEVASI